MSQKNNDERLIKAAPGSNGVVTSRPSDDRERDEGSRARLEQGARPDRTDGVDRLTAADRTTPEAERPTQLRRNPWEAQSLPTLPVLPGWHWFWATTKNPADPIQGRLQMGYVLATQSDVPGCDFLALKSGEFEGAIACNEMILLKLPEDLYRHYMRTMHHEMPLSEEERVASILETIKEQARDSQGQPLIRDMGDGTEELMRHGRVREPIFNP